MLAFLFDYGLFFAKTLTLCVAILITLGLIIALIQRQKHAEGTFLIVDLNEKLDDIRASFESETLPKAFFKHLNKKRKKEEKLNNKEKKEYNNSPRLFVLNFEGDIRASQVEELRELITAILSTANAEDEVLVVLESGGGYVHQYGLAASQLKRIREQGIPLTVAIDTLAASGGYLMACVANKIIAAPFAIVGSIGVLGQVPNFNRLLEKHNIDFEQHTAGEYKRTLTMFGKNTDKARHKFQEELEITQTLFKNFIEEHRSQVDVSKVATGEHWHATNALSLNLIDAVMTSDDYILQNHPARRIFEVSYLTKHNLKDKISSSLSMIFQKIHDGVLKLFQKPV